MTSSHFFEAAPTGGRVETSDVAAAIVRAWVGSL